MLKLNGGEIGETFHSDTELSELCQRSRGCIQLPLQLPLLLHPRSPPPKKKFKVLKYIEITS